MTAPLAEDIEQNSASLREVIRTELENNRNAFLALLDSLADSDLPRKSANLPWTVRDILFHIVLSLEYVPREVRAAQRRQNLLPMPQVIYDPINVLMTKLGALRQNCESLRRRYEAAHLLILQLLDTIQADEWSKNTRFFYVEASIEMLFRRQVQHIAEHIAQIGPTE